MKTFKSLVLALVLLLLPVPSFAQHWGYSHTDSDSMTLMGAGAVDLTSQTNWFFYNGGDAPEGAFMGWLYSSPLTPTITATVTLPSALVPGRYYIFFYGICYDSNETLQATIGGGTSTTITLNDRDDNRIWSDRVVVDVGTSSATLAVTLTRNPGTISGDQRYLFRGLFITSNSEYTVNRDGIAVKLTYPTSMDDSTAVKGNIVPNGGFETGIDAGWGFVGEGGGRTTAISTMWDSATGYEGSGSLKVTFVADDRISPGSTDTIVSRVYHLKPNKKYTVSAWVKRAASTYSVAAISLRNTFIPPAGYPAQVILQGSSIDLTNSWQRIYITGYALEYPTADYQIFLDIGMASGSDTISIDAIQLEEGTITDYAAAADVEAAPIIDISAKPGNIYYTDETLTSDLAIRNNTATTQSKILKYEIYDFMNRLLRSGSTTLSVPAATTQHGTFDISTTGKQGIFRAKTWIDNAANTEREVVYSITPRPPTTGIDTTSLLGIHPNHTAFQLKTIQRLGIKWSRALSPTYWCRWGSIEPTEGVFTWFDAEVALGATYGLTPMCTIGTNTDWPAWADNGAGLPNLTKWSTFVTQLVTHYSASIKYWEIWNESYAAFPTRPDFYAQLLKTATDAIEAADPTAKIVGMGGDPPAYIQSVIDQLAILYPTWTWATHLDVLSTHDYPDGIPPEGLTTFINTYGVPIWNTETGSYDRGFYQGVNSNFALWGKLILPYQSAVRYYEGMIGAADQLVSNFTRTIASGQTRYFYYDSRYYVAPNYFVHHPTMWEYDGTIRAKGIAYAIAGSLIDHSTGTGNASTDANSYFLVFTETPPVAALFSSDKKARQVTISLSTSQFQTLDMMGNAITNSTTIQYGRIPVYIKGIGITATTLRAALAAGTVALRSDTVAPNVSISDAPTGAGPGNLTASGNFRVRWIGLDDISYPNVGEINTESNAPSDIPDPDAILYSYQLVGYDGSYSAYAATTLADYSAVPTGSYIFSVKAKDAAGNVSTPATRTITIGSPSSAPTITTASPLVTAQVAVSYSVTLAVSGGTSPYSWSAVSLPAGLSLNSSTGALTGTPTASGSYVLAVRVTDAVSLVGSKDLALTIDPAALTITTATPLTAGATYTPYSATFAATGGTSPYTWTVSAGSIPTGTTLSSGGALSGTPTAGCSCTFTIRVTDTASRTTTKAFAITVTTSATPLFLSSISPTSGRVGRVVTVTFTGSGFTGTALAVQVSGTGITLGSPASITSTSFTATFTISNNAAHSVRTVTVSTTEGGTSAAVNFTVVGKGGKRL